MSCMDIGEANDLVRDWLFLTGTSGDQSRIVNEQCPQKWPLMPAQSCNLGFLLGHTGLAICYVCGCVTNAARNDRPLWSLRVGKDGTYKNAVFQVLSTDERLPVNGGFSNAALLKLYDIEHHGIDKFPCVRRDFPKAGERVYSLASINGMWTLAHGEVHPDEKYGNHDILVCMSAYHGYCGSPLFDAEGNLLGFGATMFFEKDRARDLSTVRAYGKSRYTHLASILEAAVPTSTTRDRGVQYV